MDGAEVLSRRQRKILVKTIRVQKAAEPRPEPAPREEFVKPEVRHADDTIIPGLTGRGAILRADNLKKLWDAGKITSVQYSAGNDYREIVENFFACASGLAKLSEEAGRVGGAGDPITRYLKGRPARQIDGRSVGYIPTQRPRNPASMRPRSDGWTRTKLEAMTEFSRMARLVEALPRDPRTALCLLVVDPNRPDIPALSVGAASRRLFGSDGTSGYNRLTRWLREGLDEINNELAASGKIAA